MCRISNIRTFVVVSPNGRRCDLHWMCSYKTKNPFLRSCVCVFNNNYETIGIYAMSRGVEDEKKFSYIYVFLYFSAVRD